MASSEFKELVKLLFVKPRTQKEAVEFLYQKDYGDMNIRPFADARQELFNEGKLENDNSLRMAEWKTTDLDIENEEEVRNFLTLPNIEKLPYTERNEEGRLELTHSYSQIISTIDNAFSKDDPNLEGLVEMIKDQLGDSLVTREAEKLYKTRVMIEDGTSSQ